MHFPVHRCTRNRILSLHWLYPGNGSQHRNYHFKSLWSLFYHFLFNHLWLPTLLNSDLRRLNSSILSSVWYTLRGSWLCSNQCYKQVLAMQTRHGRHGKSVHYAAKDFLLLSYLLSVHVCTACCIETSTARSTENTAVIVLFSSASLPNKQSIRHNI
jgi:hypothetical protein